MCSSGCEKDLLFKLQGLKRLPYCSLPVLDLWNRSRHLMLCPSVAEVGKSVVLDEAIIFLQLWFTCPDVWSCQQSVNRKAFISCYCLGSSPQIWFSLEEFWASAPPSRCFKLLSVMDSPAGLVQSARCRELASLLICQVQGCVAGLVSLGFSWCSLMVHFPHPTSRVSFCWKDS